MKFYAFLKMIWIHHRVSDTPSDGVHISWKLSRWPIVPLPAEQVTEAGPCTEEINLCLQRVLKEYLKDQYNGRDPALKLLIFYGRSSTIYIYYD